MKKLKLNLLELKVDTFETTKNNIYKKGTVGGYCDELSTQTGAPNCVSHLVNCSLNLCTQHTCYQSNCDQTCGVYHD